MAFLQQELGVAMSGAKGDVGGFKLWQATDQDVVLYVTKQPVLAKGENGRYQLAVTRFIGQKEGTAGETTGDTTGTIGGTAIFTVTSAPQFTPQQLAEVTESWRAQLPAIDPRFPPNPKFVPLNTQKGKATVLINELSGTPDAAHNDSDVGTPGGTNSFLVKLTAEGAQEWAQAIKMKTNVAAGVKMTYEYLRWLPDTGAEVIVHGERAFTHLSGALKASYNGVYYGGSAQIEAAWEEMRRNGTVEVVFIGTPPDPALMQEMVTTFADKAREQLFESLFRPAPDIKPAEAGSSGGIFGGANFALKFTKSTEITDLRLTIRFRGWTWLTASMDADLTSMFADLDDSYLTEVNLEQSTQASIVVDSDEKVKTVGCSWKASEGKAPESPVFDAEGGVKSFVVTSARPNDVLVSATAKIVYDEPKFPVVQIKNEEAIGDGGNMMVFKPNQYIGRHQIYLYIVDNAGKIKYEIDEKEHVIVNVAYTFKDTLTDPRKPKTKTIRASGKITGEGPMEFSYPFDPTAEEGKAVFSAFGVIGGKLVRAKAQPISFTEDAVFIIASPKEIKLVSEAAIPESARASADALVRSLLADRARPNITKGTPEVVRAYQREEQLRRNNRQAVRAGEAQRRHSEVLRYMTAESVRREAEMTRRAAEVARAKDTESRRIASESVREPSYAADKGGPRSSTATAERVITGRVEQVEYTVAGNYLRVNDGRRSHRIPLHRGLAGALDQFDEGNKQVTVTLDDSGMAESLVVSPS